MPPQLKRLIPLFLAFIGLFLIVRYLLIPDSFGQFGHYRGASLLDNESHDMVHASRAQCYECHEDIKDKLDNDVHADLSCLTCHGPGLSHVDNPEADNIIKESGRQFCGRCHHINAARPLDVVYQVDIKTHHIETDDCIECHNPHQVWEGLE